jgi:WD40 repeat protein
MTSPSLLALVLLAGAPALLPPGNREHKEAPAPRLLARIGGSHFRQGTGSVGAQFSADRKTLVTFDLYDNVHVWDTATGQRRLLLSDVMDRQAGALALAPNGRTLAVVCHGGIRVWDLATGKEIRPGIRRQPARVSALHFSPDSKVLFSAACDGQLRAWDPASGKMLHEHRVSPWHALDADCSADGKVLVLFDDRRTGHFFEVATGKPLLTVRDCNVSPPHRRALAFSPDGRYVAAARGNTSAALPPHSLGVYDLTSGKPLFETRAPWARSLTFAPDGKALLAAHRDSTTVWQVSGGKRIQHVKPESGTVRPFAFSEDGQALLATSGAGLIRWDVATGRQLDPSPPTDPGMLLALSPDGRLVATCPRPGQVLVLDSATGKERARLPGTAPAAFSPDGALLARAVRVSAIRYLVRFYDLRAGKDRDDRDELFDRHRRRINAVAFTADGTTLVTGTQGGKVRLFGVASGRHLAVLPPADSQPFEAVALSRDGRHLATALGGSPAHVRLWDLSRGKPVLDLKGFDQNGVRSVAFSPDGMLLATACDRVVHLFEVATGQQVRQHSLGGVSGEAIVAFSHAGRVLAATRRFGYHRQQGNNELRLWDTATGREMPALQDLDNEVNELAFSADGTRLATGLSDHRVLIWDVSALSRLLPDLPPAPKDDELPALWEKLADRDAVAAHRAAWQLVAAGDRGIRFLASRMRPAPVADDKKVRQALANLDSNRPATRKRAYRQLEELLDQVQPVLRRERRKTTSAEVRKRLGELLEVSGVIKSTESLRHVRAIAVLERIATPRAKQLLEQLARGATDAPETRQAKQALLRLYDK